MIVLESMTQGPLGAPPKAAPMLLSNLWYHGKFINHASLLNCKCIKHASLLNCKFIKHASLLNCKFIKHESLLNCCLLNYLFCLFFGPRYMYMYFFCFFNIHDMICILTLREIIWYKQQKKYIYIYLGPNIKQNK